MTIDRDQQTDALIIATAKGNVPLQVVRWSGARQAVTSSTSSKVIPLPAGLEGMEISAVEDVYINFGIDDTVVASSTIANNGSRLFLAGVQIVPVPINPATGLPYTFMAVIRKSTDGIFQVESGNVNVPFPALPSPPPPNLTVLLLHLDDDMLDSTVVDSGPSAHVCTRNGVTAEASGQFAGAGDFGTTHNTLRNISVADSDDFDFGTGDFTVEGWVNWSVIPSDGGGAHNVIASKYGAAGNRSWRYWVTSARLMTLTYSVDGTAAVSVQTAQLTLVAGTWYHVAVTRENNVIRMFLAGVEKASSDEGSKDYFAGTIPCIIGESGEPGVELPFTGDIDEVRITKGEAIYTAGFTPPTAPFTS